MTEREFREICDIVQIRAWERHVRQCIESGGKIRGNILELGTGYPKWQSR